MEVPIYERWKVINKAKQIVKEKNIDPLEAVKMAEKEIEEETKKEWGKDNE